jgi:hypothetical protein
MATVNHLDGMARDTAKQLDDLNTEKNEARLAEGGQCLSAALAEFAPVMTEVDAWMVAHKEEPPTWEVNGRSNGILKRIFSSLAPVAKPLNNIEKSPGFMKSESIDAHLDAAISAAESVKSGNRYQSDRIILHAKEIAELMANHPVLAGGLEPRIKKLIRLVDQILVDNPYLKRSLDEALGPIRNLK